MDKKNTMLLTVIAVATLLVAVVGATFAYFTATRTAEGTTTVTATTEVIGAVVITNPTTDMHINLKAIDMDKTDVAKSYFATKTAAGYVTGEKPEFQPVANVAITGGMTDTIYSCSYTMTVDASAVLEAEDAYVYFNIPEVANITDVTIAGYTGKVDLTTADTFTVSFKAKGNASGNIVEAGFELINKTTPQDYLKEEELEFTVSNGDAKEGSLSCTVVSQ